VRFIGDIDGVILAEGEAGQLIQHTLRQALSAAAHYKRPVRFEGNAETFIAYPNGSYRRIERVDINEPYGIAPYGITGANDERHVAPIEIPKSFSKPKRTIPVNGKRKLIL
jgi:hypothetical protein